MIELPSIQQLENFIIYGKVRNFATAAHRANITQSAFSFQMKKLEEIVGTQLVVHGENTIELTKEGQIFLAKAEKIVSELKQSLSEMKKISRRRSFFICRCVDVFRRCIYQSALNLF